MRWNRTALLAAAPVAVVAAIAGVQSFSHIEGLALRAHQSITDARLLPFSIDGLIVAGVVVVMAGYRLGWLSAVLGIAATVFCNIMSGLPYGALSAAVSAWPAIAFTVASFVLERWLKAQVGRKAQAGTGPDDTAPASPNGPSPSSVVLNGHSFDSGWAAARPGGWS
jgi:hypothetical protein